MSGLLESDLLGFAPSFFLKQSLQYTGFPSVGLNGTSHFSPHLSQTVLNSGLSLADSLLPPNLELLSSPLSSLPPNLEPPSRPPPNLDGPLLGLSPLGSYLGSSLLDLLLSLPSNLGFLLKLFILFVRVSLLFINLRLILWIGV